MDGNLGDLTMPSKFWILYFCLLNESDTADFLTSPHHADPHEITNPRSNLTSCLKCVSFLNIMVHPLNCVALPQLKIKPSNDDTSSISTDTIVTAI